MTFQGGPGEPTESELGQRPDNGSHFFGGATELLPFPMPFTPESYQAMLVFNQNFGQDIEALEEKLTYVLAQGQEMAKYVTEYEDRRNEYQKTCLPFVAGKVAVRPPDPEIEEMASGVRFVHHVYSYHHGLLPSFQSEAGRFSTILAMELANTTTSDKIRIGGRDYEIGYHRDEDGNDEIAGLVRVGWYHKDPNRDVVFGQGSLSQRLLQTRYVGANSEAGRLAINTRHLRIATPEDWREFLQGIRQVKLFEKYFQKIGSAIVSPEPADLLLEQ